MYNRSVTLEKGAEISTSTPKSCFHRLRLELKPININTATNLQSSLTLERFQIDDKSHMLESLERSILIYLHNFNICFFFSAYFYK